MRTIKQADGSIGKHDPEGDGPWSETERFLAVVDPRHNEAVTGESGVKRNERDHELRCQRRSLDEFS